MLTPAKVAAHVCAVLGDGLQERGGVVTVVRLPVCVVERDFYREIILAPDRETVLGDAWRRSGSRTGRRPRG